VFDVFVVAIDAWLSADVRNATRAWSAATNGGGMPGIDVPPARTLTVFAHPDLSATAQ
jgi:hypothetical protein